MGAAIDMVACDRGIAVCGREADGGIKPVSFTGEAPAQNTLLEESWRA